MLKNRIVIVIITAILAIFAARGIYNFVTATIMDDINNTKNEQEIIKGQQEEAVRKYNELEAEISIYEREIAKVEEDIANSRKYYNGVVRMFNDKVEMFPSNIFAKLFGYKTREMFEVNEQERENVQVKF